MTRRSIGTWVVSLFITCAIATAQDLPQPTLITLHVKDQPLTDVLKEISRQANFPITPARGNEELAANEKVTADFDAQPLWLVLHGVCPFQWAPEFDQNGSPIVLRMVGSGVTQLNRLPISQAGAFTVAAVDMSQAADYSLPPKQSDTHSSTFRVQIYVDPAVHLLQTWQPMALEPAQTDTGAAVTPALHEPAHFDSVYGPPWRSETTALIFSPRDGSRRIVRLRGRIKLLVETESERWVIDNPADSINASHLVASSGERLRLRAFNTQESQRCEITIGIEQPDAPPTTRPEFQVSSSGFPLAGVHATDAAGVEYDRYGGTTGGSIPGPRIMTQNIIFSARRGVATGPITRITLDMPAKVQQIEIPFEFKDLPLP